MQEKVACYRKENTVKFLLAVFSSKWKSTIKFFICRWALKIQEQQSAVRI